MPAGFGVSVSGQCAAVWPRDDTTDFPLGEGQPCRRVGHSPSVSSVTFGSSEG